jgi:hypothetical protein
LVLRMMKKAPGAVMPRQVGKVWVLEFPMAAWESSLVEMCSDAAVDVCMGARVEGIRRQGERIAALQIEGAEWVETGAVIDCTGGGGLLQLVGEEAMLPPEKLGERMLGGFSVRLAGICGDLEMLRLQVPYALRMAVEKGALPGAARFTVFYPGSVPGEGICKLAVHPEDFESGAAERIAGEVVAYLVGEIAAFAGATVVEKSPRALARDGRRLRGKFMVTENDVVTARKHGVGATHAWWPMERWDVEQGPSYDYPPAGDFYDIPAEALRSAAVENLFAAGGCVCATAGAAASIRASGICLATGDAAGRLAASFISAVAENAGA